MGENLNETNGLGYCLGVQLATALRASQARRDVSDVGEVGGWGVSVQRCGFGGWHQVDQVDQENHRVESSH